MKEKEKRQQALSTIKGKVLKALTENKKEGAYSENDIVAAFKKISSRYMREMILNENRRVDGRSSDQVRSISIEMAPLPRTHGSALFTRGEHSL